MCIGIFELGACVDSLGRLKLPSEPLSEGAVSSLLSLSEPPPLTLDSACRPVLRAEGTLVKFCPFLGGRGSTDG